MKFMKLGSKPDTFFTTEAIRSVSSEVSSDLMIQVKGSRYLLHKFPLLSKCSRLQKLCAESPASSQRQVVQLPDFPVGVEAFEVCAKFCYGITITVSAYNLVAARCAAEYLQMTEEAEKGNLIRKIEAFFNSCILNGWKDLIVTLESTKAFSSWSEDLGITSRCIEAIASRILTNPSKVTLSHSDSQRWRDDSSSYSGAESQKQTKSWWGEDIAELGIDLYWRTMIAIKSGGKVPSNLIGEALQIYASHQFPTKQCSAWGVDPETALASTSHHRMILESIVSLLPAEKGAVPCSFVLKLLKAANKLGASSSFKAELARRAGIQLEEASMKDLLIPSACQENGMTKYDVDIIISVLEQYIPYGSELKVARLIDGCLQEISDDVNLPVSKMISIAESVPASARVDHDDLYRAIDTYLKTHPNLSKTERKRLCRVLDCRKLSMEASMHAAQNELLPLRVVVQVLFYEQTRAAMSGNKVANLPANIKAMLATQDDDDASSRYSAARLSTTTSIAATDKWSVSGLKTPSKSRPSTLKEKLAEEVQVDGSEGLIKSSKLKALHPLPTRPKSMFSKLLSMNRSASVKR